MLEPLDWDQLIHAACEARKNAYCPYSGYAVGVAIADERHQIATGANVENASYGATICAERSAVCHMVAAGGTRILRVVVATQDGGWPCGICLQVLSEFCHHDTAMEIAIASPDRVAFYSLAELLPHAFARRAETGSGPAREPNR